MHVVTVGITNIVLHVADDGVVPVGDVQGPVLANDCIGRTEVSIFAIDQLKAWSSPDVPKLTGLPISLAIKGVLLDAQEADRIADQEIVLQVFWKVLRRQDRVGRDRAEFFGQQRVHLEAIAFGTHLI